MKNCGLAGLRLKMDGPSDDMRCPVCGAQTLGSDRDEFFSGALGCGVRCDCKCDECGSEWALTYKLDFAYIYYDGTANDDDES